MNKKIKEQILDKLESQDDDEIKMKEINRLSDRAIKLQKEVIKITDKVYEIDELEGERLLELLSDEKYLRS